MQVPELPPHIAIGRYRTLERLGAGARSVVYKAQDTETGRLVALKIMAIVDDMELEESRTRFEREAAALSQFSHPNIVAFAGTATFQWQQYTLPCLAMEFLEALQTLDVAARERNDREWLLDRFDELMAALEVMHAAGVVHRDLKPANLGVPGDGHLKVMDLGLARVRESKLTNQGDWLGSLGYMAPEQLVDARRVDHRSDIYSVGMILLELLGGGHPLGPMTSARATRAIIGGTIPATPVAIPEALDTLARWFCAVDPNKRPNSARAARGELLGVRRRLQTSPPPAPDPAPAGGSVAGFLEQQLVAARSGQGGAVLLCGQTPMERRVWMDAVSRQAESMGIRVFRMQGSPQLAATLGCGPHARELFYGLSAVAELHPTLVCVDDLAAWDVEMPRLMDICAQNADRVLILVAAGKAPPDAGAATIFQLR